MRIEKLPCCEWYDDAKIPNSPTCGEERVVACFYFALIRYYVCEKHERMIEEMMSKAEKKENENEKTQKIVLCDFDGVLHSYTSGWKGARVVDGPPTEGAISWIEDFILQFCDIPDSIAGFGGTKGEFQFCIYSVRSRRWGGRKAMRKWLVKWGLDPRFLEVIKFPLMKPSTWITIDDRAICFNGDFPSGEEIKNFVPWNKKGR